MTMPGLFLLVFLVLAGSCGGDTAQVPMAQVQQVIVSANLCSIREAYSCFQRALDTAVKSVCNWQETIPSLENCVLTATKGCTGRVQHDFDRRIDEFNKTLHRDNLNKAACQYVCAHLAKRSQEFENCKKRFDGLEATLSKLKAIGAEQEREESDTKTRRRQLCNHVTLTTECLTYQAGTCEKLLKKVREELQKPDLKEAEVICNKQGKFYYESTPASISGKNTSTSESSPTVPPALETRWLALIVCLLIAVLVAVAVALIHWINNKRFGFDERQQYEYEYDENWVYPMPYDTRARKLFY